MGVPPPGGGGASVKFQWIFTVSDFNSSDGQTTSFFVHSEREDGDAILLKGFSFSRSSNIVNQKYIFNLTGI